MSISLYFRDTSGKLIDFPYQTRTECSKAIVNTSSRSKQLRLISKDLSWKKRHLNSWQKRTYRKCKNILRDKSLTLFMG